MTSARQDDVRSFPFGTGSAVFDRAGRLVAVVARPGGSSYLVGDGGLSARLDSGHVGWAPTELSEDDDELELRGSLGPEGFVVALRHSFGATWRVRLVLANQAAEPRTVRELRLGWSPPSSCPARVLAGGAVAAYAVLPPEGNDPRGGPVLAGVLTRGEVNTLGPSGIGVDRVLLGPGARYVLTWVWTWHDTPRTVARERRGQTPRRLVLTTGESVRLAADPDAAVEAPGLDLHEERGELELSSSFEQATTIRVSSVRGAARFPIRWVPPLDEVLAEAAQELWTGPRNRAGVVRLPDAAAGLLVQRQLARTDVADRDGAEDALDALTARLRDGPMADPLSSAYLCAEASRTLDAELLSPAEELLRTATGPTPGLGLLVVQLSLACLALGRPVPRMLGRLTGLLAARPSSAQVVGAVGGACAQLELAAVVGGSGSDLAAWARAVAFSVGAGVTGVTLRPLPVAEQAYRAVVLGLLPEDVSRSLLGALGCTGHELAAWTVGEVTARLDASVVTSAHAWLALSLAST